MEIQTRVVLNRFLRLIVVSFFTAISYYLLISFDSKQNETPIHFTDSEIFIGFPLMMIMIFLPYVLFYGSIAFLLKSFIEKIVGLKNVIFSIVFYIFISIVIIPMLPMINTAANHTAYEFFINPYYLIPFIGVVILILFEINSKKES